MNDFANAIGWAVIIFGVFFIINYLLKSANDETRLQRERTLITRDHVMKLAYRKIYLATTEERIRLDVKLRYRGWAYLELELNDSEYDKKMKHEDLDGTYSKALEVVDKVGLPYILENGDIVSRNIVF